MSIYYSYRYIGIYVYILVNILGESIFMIL